MFCKNSLSIFVISLSISISAPRRKASAIAKILSSLFFFINSIISSNDLPFREFNSKWSTLFSNERTDFSNDYFHSQADLIAKSIKSISSGTYIKDIYFHLFFYY